MKTYEESLKYRSEGWSLIPLKGKRPAVAWKQYQGRQPDNSELYEWFGEGKYSNLGIVCGTVSGGLLVVDWDDLNAYNGWALEHPELADTKRVETGNGGRHAYYQIRDGKGLSTQAFSWKDKGAGEIRFNGGQVVAPPSIHPDTGRPYRWLTGKDIPIKEIHSLDELGIRLRKRTDAPAKARGRIPVGHRNNRLVSLAGTMKRQGMADEAIRQAILTENQEHCDPPLTERELALTIFKSLETWETPERHIELDIKLTDVGNGKRLARRWGEIIRFVTVKRSGYWIVWDGKRWATSSGVELEWLAKETVAAMYGEASSLTDEEDRKKLARHAIKSEHIARVRAMIEAARSEPGIPISIKDFDIKPWLLNVANGTLDLRSGHLRDHSTADLLTKVAPTAYGPAAKCPRWQEFLNEVMDGREQLVDYLQRVLGYTLTGSTQEDVFWILYGTGANGKTTFLEAIRAVLGEDYALQAPVEMLLKKRPGGIPSDIARLRGARFVTATEIGEGRRLDEQVIKHLTGHDTITARPLYGEFFEFTPSHKILVAGNYKPIIKETSLAMWRRPHLVPFSVTFEEKEQDKELLGKLTAEAPGILAWMVEGCLAWQKEGLKPPDEVRAATEGYRKEMDVLGPFIEDCCILAENVSAGSGDLYKAYKAWCEENGEKPLGSRGFGNRLTDRGVDRARDRSRRFYIGIGLKELEL